MKTVFSHSEFMSRRGCYSREDAAALIGSKTELTIEEILNFNIPLKDKGWFILNSCELTTDQLRQFAIGCALVVLPIYENKYPGKMAPRKAIEAAKAYLANEISIDELSSARYDAAYAADAADAAYAAYAAYAADAAYAAYAADAAYAAADAADAADAPSYKDLLLAFFKEFTTVKETV